MPSDGTSAGGLYRLQPWAGNGGASSGILPAHFQRRIGEIRTVCQKRLGAAGEGRSEEALAEAGIAALADFIREIGLPTTLRQLG